MYARVIDIHSFIQEKFNEHLLCTIRYISTVLEPTVLTYYPFVHILF